MKRRLGCAVSFTLLACADDRAFLEAPVVAGARTVVIATNDGTGLRMEMRSLEDSSGASFLETTIAGEDELQVLLVHFREVLADVEREPRPRFLAIHETWISADGPRGWETLDELPPELDRLLYGDHGFDCDRLVASSEMLQLEPGLDFTTITTGPDGRTLLGGHDEETGRSVLAFLDFEGRGRLETLTLDPEFTFVWWLVSDGRARIYGYDEAGWLFATNAAGEIQWRQRAPEPLELRAGADGRVIAFTTSTSPSLWALVETATTPVDLEAPPEPVLDVAVLENGRLAMVSQRGAVFIHDGQTWVLDLPPPPGEKPVAVFGGEGELVALAPGLLYRRQRAGVWNEHVDPLRSDVGLDRAGALLMPGAHVLVGVTQTFIGFADDWCLVFSTVYRHEDLTVNRTRRELFVVAGRKDGTWIMRTRY